MKKTVREGSKQATGKLVAPREVEARSAPTPEQEDKSRPQDVQPAEPATAKQGRSLINSLALQSGKCPAWVARVSERTEHWQGYDRENPAPCRQNYGAFLAAVLTLLECECVYCENTAFALLEACRTLPGTALIV